jgi:hypothetical protein
MDVHHEDLLPVVVAQEMLFQDLDEAEMVRRLRVLYGLIYIDAAAAIAAARVLQRHGQDLTAEN